MNIHKYILIKIREKFSDKAKRTEIEDYLMFIRFTKDIRKQIVNDLCSMNLIKKENRQTIRIN